MHHASRNELNETAEILYNYHSQKSGDKGGIVGVIDFKANEIRFPDQSNDQLCCVLDTPIGRRHAHADIICNQNGLSEIEKNDLMKKLYNNIGGNEAFKKFTSVTDFEINNFVPQKYRP